MQTTLFEYDTTIFADSVEAIPNSHDGLFLSGTYQLDEQTRLRDGKITLHQLSGDDNKVNTYDSVDTSGVLDMKFNPEECGSSHTLAVALSDGYLSLLNVDYTEGFNNVWKQNERILVEDESTICLSVDWSNQMISNPNPLIAVSLSNGKMATCIKEEDSLIVKDKWNAHSLMPGVPAEVWITSFDPQDSNVLFSGGDDGIMKQWDLRMISSYVAPVAVCKEFQAGVTSMCWNKQDANYITVGSYDGHVRLFDKRQIQHSVSDYDVGNNAGIWRIKYKHNPNYYRTPIDITSPTKNEMVIAAMRAGFVVLNYDEQHVISLKNTYLEQGTESLPYGVDYIYKKGHDINQYDGYVGSCSFYNHLMHVWKYEYSPYFRIVVLKMMRFDIYLLLSILLCLSFQSVTAEETNFAFVTIYYPNAHQSRSEQIAIRTMYKSFLSVKSKATFLVLSPDNTPKTDLNIFEADGIPVQTISMTNAYKQHEIVVDYQKTKNLEHIWSLTQFKRVIFVDPYTIFNHNFDSLFDCSYLCLRDEQPLLYSNSMIVITPGHEESRQIFHECVNGKATIDQYTLYNHMGYYSTELYEKSQAAPVFKLGDPEQNDQLLRRFLNFVNFPVLMWYEKFNWNLYSCSGLNDPNMPVYSINYHYTLGHMEMFLPTHWFSYHYVWQMNNYWLSWRTQINESFFTTHLYCLLLVVGVLAGGMLVIPCIATCLSFFYRTLQPAVRSLYFTSSVMKLIVSLFILGIWYVSRIIVPYYLYPSAGYLYFFLFYTLFGCIWIFGLNRGTNAILGTKMTCKHAVTLLSTCHFVLAVLYSTAAIERIPWLYRLALMAVQFFIELYCIYSQISPLQEKNTVMYTALPE